MAGDSYVYNTEISHETCIELLDMFWHQRDWRKDHKEKDRMDRRTEMGDGFIPIQGEDSIKPGCHYYISKQPACNSNTSSVQIKRHLAVADPDTCILRQCCIL